jgi:hypothetical protein
VDERNRLSPAARAIVEEEEVLLRRTRAALAEAAARRPRIPRGMAMDELRSLREEAARAHERDLPALLQALRSAQALAGRREAPPPPDPAAPYFGHLRLEVEGEPRDYLLGRTSFADLDADVRVVDWRLSPIARVFYQGGEGTALEEHLPGGLLEGVVLARRVVIVEGGVLRGVIDGTLQLVRGEDGAWDEVSGGPLLGGGAGTAARPGILGTGAGRRGAVRADVTALLDAEQAAAIAAEPSRPLLVLGSAGSGKTTVALHRLARIAAARRGARLAVVVPEEGLARLSRRLLEPLGLPRARVETLERWLSRAAAAAFGGRTFRLSPDTPPAVAALKRHPALRGPLLARVAGSRRTAFASLRPLLAEVFTDRGFLRGVVEAAQGTLAPSAVEEVVRHTLLQIAAPLARQLEGVDPERLVTLDGRPIEAGTPDELAGTVDLEDLVLCLFLRGRAGGEAAESLDHLVADEAEDLSLFELELLGRLLGEGASSTVAGDEAQQTLSSFAGWEPALEALGARDAAVVRLEISYRCPRPVAELAAAILGAPAPLRAARNGVPVGHHHFPDEAQAHLFLAGALQDLSDREPRASVGVVCAGPDAARALHASLSEIPACRLVLHGEFAFEPGVDVTDVANAKGLEWDYVVVPDASARAYPRGDEARRRLHVAVTRASHQLWIVSTGRRSPLLPPLPAAGESLPRADGTGK